MADDKKQEYANILLENAIYFGSANKHIIPGLGEAMEMGGNAIINANALADALEKVLNHRTEYGESLDIARVALKAYRGE